MAPFPVLTPPQFHDAATAEQMGGWIKAMFGLA